MDNRINFKEITMFAGTYISVCIGSGFATGQEIIQFFSAYGTISILSSLFCMVILSYCGANLLEIGKRVGLKSNNDIFEYLCGKWLGKFFKFFMPIFFFCSFVVMVSGAGSAIQQYYGINKNIGSLFFIIIVLLSILLGINKLIDILGNIGPMIVIISIVIGIVTIARNYGALGRVNEVVSVLNITKASNSWWITAPLYSGLNVIIVTPFLVGVGKTSKNRLNCIWGGIIGGIAFMIAAIVMNIGLLSDIQNVYMKEIPTLYMADKISPIVGVMFSVMLMAGIYTTAVPLLWSTCSSFAKEGTYKFKYIAIGCSIVGFIGARLPFATLVNFIYPISGAMGVIIIIGIFLRQTKIIID